MSHLKLISLASFGDQAALSSPDFSAHLCMPLKQSHLFDSIIRVTSQTLPLEVSTSEDKVDAEHSKEQKISKEKSLVLIVEDNPINQMLAKLHLEKLDYLTHCVGNGKEALDTILNNTYDLILMDCQMPEMDGYAATRAIRKLEKISFRKRIPIIAMTANAMKGDQEKCLDSGMDGYLPKPINRSKLQELLEHWISKPIMKKAIDDQALQSLKNSTGEEASIEIINAYLNFLPQSLEKLQAAYEDKDLNQLIQLAHSLKSSSAGVGGKKIK